MEKWEVRTAPKGPVPGVIDAGRSIDWRSWSGTGAIGGTIEVLRGTFEADSHYGCKGTRLVVNDAAKLKTGSTSGAA